MTEELKDKELSDIKHLRARMTENIGFAIDHAYNLGFFDRLDNVLDKIRAEIEQFADTHCSGDDINIYDVFQILDKYKAE